MNKYDYLYVSDIVKHEVIKWKIGNTNGALVADGFDQNIHFHQFNESHYIFVEQEQSIYVPDSENHRIM